MRPLKSDLMGDNSRPEVNITTKLCKHFLYNNCSENLTVLEKTEQVSFRGQPVTP